MTFNKMQTIKRRFFAMRNGVVADTLRRAGSPFRIIFGLNLPQLVEIADEFGPDAELAQALWENGTTRESRLVAPMLMPRELMGSETALQWASSVETVEVADVLCHRLLRHLPYAWDIADVLKDSEEQLQRYTALRLAANMMYTAPEQAEAIATAEAERQCELTAPLARMVLEETDFILRG